MATAEQGGVPPSRLAPARVLLVDDYLPVLHAHATVLRRGGYRVEEARNGREAIEALRLSSFDLILTDIDMPGMTGLELLEEVRKHDLDVPVLLITGAPSVKSAVEAIEHGALRYLVKPVDPQELVQVSDDAVRFHHIAKAKRQALELAGLPERQVGDRAGLTVSFERALRSLYVVFQPVVSLSRREVFGYEALLRTRETSLPNPGALFDAAERLDRLHELSRAARALAVEPVGMLDEGMSLLVNIHPLDLLDESLFSTEGALAVASRRVILEITERASLDGIGSVRKLVGQLRENGFRLALDDLGAGYAGLTSFALLEPELVKLDMVLVRNIGQEPTRQTVVRTMVTMCNELGIQVIAEGIETIEERDELVRAGCDLMQGFLFARPGPAFPRPTF